MQTIKKIIHQHKRGLLISTGAACAVYALLTVYAGYHKLLAALMNVNALQAVAILSLALVGFSIRSIRWYYYINTIARVSFQKTTRAFSASYALSVIPGRIGHLLRCYLLRLQVDPARTLGALFVEQYLNVIVVLGYVTFGVSRYYTGSAWPYFIAFGAGLLGVALVYINDQGVEGVIHCFFNFIELGAKWRAQAQTVQESITELLAPAPLIVGVGSGVIAWGAEGAIFYFAFQAVGIELPILQIVFVHYFASFVGALSVFPGGIGGYEVVTVSALGLYGVAPSVAVGGVLIIRSITLVIEMGVGLLAWSTYAADAIFFIKFD